MLSSRLSPVVLLVLLHGATASSPWDDLNYSPKSRELSPVRIYRQSVPCTDLAGVVEEWGPNPGSPPIPALNLSCKAGGTIKGVAFASFGTPAGQCGEFTKGACHAEKSSEIVEELCVGKPWCVIPSDPTIRDTNSPLKQLFGDPCEGTKKRLAVELTGCEPGERDEYDEHNEQSLFPLTLKGRDAYVTLDFGKNVGGFTTISFGSSTSNTTMGMAYSESSNYAVCPSDAVSACTDGAGQAGAGDHSNGGHGPDGTLTVPVRANSTYTPPVAHMRGGFRYLNLFLEGDGVVEIRNVSVYFTAAPTMQDPSAYKGHFYSSDELVNQIWYACAYTVQMCSIDPAHGRQWGPPDSGWNNGVLIGVGKTIIVDGAKRDRTIWPGDMGVSTLTAFTTTGDTESAKQSLNTLYLLQSPTGMLPYVGPEVFCQKPMDQSSPTCGGSWNSDTYHLWALSGTANTFRFLGAAEGKAWLGGLWPKYKQGVNASVAKIGAPHGLMIVDKPADWQRGGQGGENIAANALLCGVLHDAAELAVAMGDTAAAAFFKVEYNALKKAINTVLWDESKGAYKDNPTSLVYPQDGNSIAVWMNITDPPSRKDSVLAYLETNWSPIGAISTEWVYQGKPAIGNFPGSMEINAHLSAGGTHTAKGLDLLKRQWGYQLNSPNSTKSTFWEGYQADGQFAFQGIYMSHAHGWAAGPASALSLYVMGLRPLPPAVQQQRTGTRTRYAVVPQPSLPSLRWINGSMAMKDGRIELAWNASDDGRFTLEIALDEAHCAASTGYIGLPLLNGLTAESASVAISSVPSSSSQSNDADTLPVLMPADDADLQSISAGGIQRLWYKHDADSAMRGGSERGCRTRFELH